MFYMFLMLVCQFFIINITSEFRKKIIRKLLTFLLILKFLLGSWKIVDAQCLDRMTIYLICTTFRIDITSRGNIG